ncbi:MAG: rubrerythrin family protein [Deferribacterota bacterium]|nr:rubrerythrin family protein [Deferribacterota bacterium]
MSKSLKGTKTLDNLISAFAGESQARNRYTYYASIADKEGYKQIADIFLETADNERMHAKRFYDHIIENLDAKEVMTLELKTTEYPFSLGNTVQNLKAAAFGEHEENTKLYPEAAKIAEEEGFKDVAIRFNRITDVEKRHEIRFVKLAENIEKGLVFKKERKVLWKCRKCGYIHEGYEPPAKCPACDHPKEFYEIFIENY